jgi:hypothetical protein
VNYAGNVPQQGEEDVDSQLSIAALLKENTQRLKKNTLKAGKNV